MPIVKEGVPSYGHSRSGLWGYNGEFAPIPALQETHIPSLHFEVCGSWQGLRASAQRLQQNDTLQGHGY